MCGVKVASRAKASLQLRGDSKIFLAWSCPVLCSPMSSRWPAPIAPPRQEARGQRRTTQPVVVAKENALFLASMGGPNLVHVVVLLAVATSAGGSDPVDSSGFTMKHQPAVQLAPILENSTIIPLHEMFYFIKERITVFN